jgi:hypothetical protein
VKNRFQKFRLSKCNHLHRYNKARAAYFVDRNEERGKFRKKNYRGQPVMKHRVDKILEALQKEGVGGGAGGGGGGGGGAQ